MGVLNIILDIGSNGAGVRDSMANDGNGWICVYHKFLLKAESQQRPSLKRRLKTHVKDLNLIKVHPPGSDRLFVILRVKTSRDQIPFTPLGHLPLNICHSTVIEVILADG